MHNQINVHLVHQTILQSLWLTWLSNAIIILGIPAASVLFWIAFGTSISIFAPFSSVGWVLSFVGIIASLGASISIAVGHQLRDRRSIRKVIDEQLVLSYAAAMNGQPLTLGGVCLNTGLAVETAKQSLYKLAKLGVCLIELDNDAREVYAFPNFSSERVLRLPHQ